MIKNKCVLIHYGELALKGRNRVDFELMLKDNIEKIAGGIVVRHRGYFVMEGGKPSHLDNIPGISWYAESIVTEIKIEKMMDIVVDEIGLKLKNRPMTFGVFVRRPNKKLPYTSVELAKKLGDVVTRYYDLKVNLRDPDIRVFVEVSDKAYLFFEKRKGLGGLPTGMSGRVLCLISGGIDSPLSSYLMMKRGCKVDLIHFHKFSDNQYVWTTKMDRIFRRINEFQLNTNVYLVPYYPFESSVIQSSDIAGYQLIIFRRFMTRISEKIAVKNGSTALVTGDSLGQVASQTMENIALIKQAVTMPIYQPLISYDKQEIVDHAQKIGTYDISIEPYQDCCSLVSLNPKTRAKSRRILEIENTLNIQKTIDQTLELISMYQL